MEAPGKDRRNGCIPVWTAGTQAERRVVGLRDKSTGVGGYRVPGTREATEAVPPLQCYREQEQTTAKRECFACPLSRLRRKQLAKAESVSWPRI